MMIGREITEMLNRGEDPTRQEITEKEISQKENLEMQLLTDDLIKKISNSRYFKYDLKFEALKNAVSVAQLIRKSWE